MSRSETAILAMSDIHYGKRTSSYDPKVFADRLKRVGERLGEIRRSMADKQIDRLVVCLLGDVNDGSDIYPTQDHHQALTNPDAQAEEVSTLLADWVQGQKEVWGKIQLEGVPGNHGRTGKRAHEAANWDIVAYRYLGLKTPDTSLRFAADEPGIHQFVVRGHRYLMYHGHQIGFGGGSPYAGIRSRVNGWLSTRAIEVPDVVMMGHFHMLSHTRINRIHVLTSGTPVTDDRWGLQRGNENSNEWWLFGVSDSRPITWQFAVDLS
jgi:predicted phosphodiesterase